MTLRHKQLKGVIMGRCRVPGDERITSRSVGLSNNEVERILKITGRDKINLAVRDMLLILEDIQGADPELIVPITEIS